MSREFYLRYPRRQRSTPYREEFSREERKRGAGKTGNGSRRTRRKTRKRRWRL